MDLPWKGALAAAVGSLAALAAVAPSPARADAYVVSTTQACFGSAVGECDTAPPVTTPGAPSNISRFYGGSDGYAWQASAQSATNFAAFSLFARASGLASTTQGDPFNYSDTRIGRAYSTFADLVTAGEGGGSGFLRFPLHVTGSASASWQNGGSYVQIGVFCSSNLPGSPTTLGPCAAEGLSFTNDATVDQVLTVDVPIVLGQPVQFTIQLNLSAGTGHLYGTASPFTGQAEGSFGAESLGAIVLDAGKNPIPGAPISLGESGFDYAPEPSSLLTALAALAALAPLRARRRRQRAIS